MKRIFSLFALLGCLLFAGPAIAADTGLFNPFPDHEDIAAPTVKTVSCNVSAGFGLGVTTVSVADQNINLKGAVIPVGVGCDYRIIGNFSVGVFADYSFGKMHSSIGDLSQQARGGLRAGYNVTPVLMIYAKAGYAQAKAVDDTVSATLVGIPVGLGFEFKFDANQALRLEYMHTGWRDKDLGFVAPVKTSTDTVTANYVFRF